MHTTTAAAVAARNSSNAHAYDAARDAARRPSASARATRAHMDARTVLPWRDVAWLCYCLVSCLPLPANCLSTTSTRAPSTTPHDDASGSHDITLSIVGVGVGVILLVVAVGACVAYRIMHPPDVEPDVGDHAGHGRGAPPLTHHTPPSGPTNIVCCFGQFYVPDSVSNPIDLLGCPPYNVQ